MNEFLTYLKLFKNDPIRIFENLLNQSKYKFVFLTVIIFGFSLGLNNIINRIFLMKHEINLGILIFALFKTALIALIVIYVYSWIIVFFNSILQSFSNQKDIFAVIAYSLIPLIIGILMISILKIILFNIPGLQSYYYLVSIIFYVVYLIFYSLTLIYLVIGNSIVTNISIVKSIASTSIIPIIYTIFEAIKILK